MHNNNAGAAFNDSATNYSVVESASIPYAEEYRVIARIHFREAEKLLGRAHAAQAEDRRHEAMLLTDLSILQRRRAEQYVRAARGEASDPIVTEILEGLQERRNNFIPLPGQTMQDDSKLPQEGRFTRALKSILHLHHPHLT